MTFVKQSDGSYIEDGDMASVVSGKVTDDTKDFGVPASGVPPPPVCEDYHTESECVAAGCYWYDGSCHGMPPDVVCSDYTTESTCVAAGCQWVDGVCRGFIPEYEPPWAVILAAVGGVITLFGVVLAIRR